MRVRIKKNSPGRKAAGVFAMHFIPKPSSMALLRARRNDNTKVAGRG
ncbi:hypothetical protein BN8_02054 [Fibrisoma limi BUZ 3]|uniref:Uncharacterized protein n=1 Tax=Fibrisoma limi BUZ 3 TaxID=1185876 RepID=I2GGH7_9BACT|nr:hypothetical protein BN8_02054 [Fibrisoma limi BUZ 3]